MPNATYTKNTRQGFKHNIVLFQIQGEANAASEAAVVKYRGVFGTITTMVRTEGARSLYNGLVAGLQRQMSFASVRIGLYDSMKQFYTRGSESKNQTIKIMEMSE